MNISKKYDIKDYFFFGFLATVLIFVMVMMVFGIKDQIAREALEKEKLKLEIENLKLEQTLNEKKYDNEKTQD